MLKVPEHKVRVIAPDIGGSFGMKSAIYNEVPLVLLGVEEDRPSGEMDEHALGGVSVRREARDNVTDAELALDKDGTFLAFRVTSFVNAGAYLQSGFQAYTGNLGTLAGVYRTPAMYVEVDRGVHPHPAVPALSRQRTARGGLRDRAHGRRRGRRS